jgi:hypothetical protein
VPIIVLPDCQHSRDKCKSGDFTEFSSQICFSGNIRRLKYCQTENIENGCLFAELRETETAVVAQARQGGNRSVLTTACQCPGSQGLATAGFA